MKKLLLGMALTMGVLTNLPSGSAAPLSEQDKASLAQPHVGLFYLYTGTVDFNIAEQMKRAKAAIDIEHDYSLALAVLDKVIELDSKNAEAYLLRGIAQSRVGEEKKESKWFNKAQDDFRAALMIEPDNPTFWFYRGECGIIRAQVLNELTENNQNCKESFNEALKLCPNYLDAIVGLGDTYYNDYVYYNIKQKIVGYRSIDESYLEESINWYNKALVLVPNHGTITAKKEIATDLLNKMNIKKEQEKREAELRSRIG